MNKQMKRTLLPLALVLMVSVFPVVFLFPQARCQRSHLCQPSDPQRLSRHEANGGNDSQKPPGTGSGSGRLHAHQGNSQPDTGTGVSKAYERGRLCESSGESQSEKGRP